MARATAASGWPRALFGLEPLLPLWRLLTSVRFALALIGFLALAGLLSVVLPQVPLVMRGNPAAVDAWLEFQKGKFGPLTEPMYRLGLFSVFAARWFVGSLVALVVSVSVCTMNRFAPIWRSVAAPAQRPPDGFYASATNRAVFATSPGGAANAAAELEAALRKRWFSVRRSEEGGASYLFADRFAWAQLATFVSHLALIMFLAGGIISRWGGYSNALFVAEGATNPVFAVSHPDQMQVEVLDAVGRFDEGGVPLDYRASLVVYQGGREVARGVSTVNGPLSYDGYRFHLAGYFGDGAELRVRDVVTRHTLFRESLALQDTIPAPAVQVRDASGSLLLDDVIVPTDFLEGASGTLITVPGTSRQFWLGVTAGAEEQWSLVVYERGDTGDRLVLAPGEAARAGDLEFTYLQAAGLPAVETAGIPGDGDRALVAMSQTPEGEAYLTILGPVDGQALTLYPNQPVRVNEREYVFEGRREFAGIEVRRDPGANFIWAAAGLLLVGLAMTFYLPRLRLWARVGRDETVVAALAEKSGSFRAEIRQLTTKLGLTERRERPDDA